MIVVNYDKGFAKMSQHPAFSPDFIGAHCAPTLRPQLQEASEVFGWLMDYYAPVLGEDGKLNWTQEDRELFNQYSDLLIRCATARLPFEYPRLNAIGIAAVPGSSPQAARYPQPASLLGAPEYPAHRQIHRARSCPVQGFLGRLGGRFGRALPISPSLVLMVARARRGDFARFGRCFRLLP